MPLRNRPSTSLLIHSPHLTPPSTHAPRYVSKVFLRRTLTLVVPFLGSNQLLPMRVIFRLIHLPPSIPRFRLSSTLFPVYSLYLLFLPAPLPRLHNTPHSKSALAAYSSSTQHSSERRGT